MLEEGEVRMEGRVNHKKILGGRVLAVLPALVVQGVWIYVLLTWLSAYSALIHMGLSLLAFLFVLYIVSNREESAYKMLWLLVILVLPFLGTVLYLLFGNRRTGKKLQLRLEESRKDWGRYLDQDEEVMAELARDDLRIGQIFGYISKMSGFPLLRNKTAIYHSTGEALFADMLEEMNKAEKFIFVEYFIVEDGSLWRSMVEIMERKVREGLDVRVIYDDVGSISTFSGRNARELRSKGIKIVAFNPLKWLSGALNNRDHRKILVIDNRVAFSGGMNLADEYINEIERFGYWKDVGFKIMGAAVQSYTFMFCEFWSAFSEEKIEFDIERNMQADGEDGYILPYYDSPANKLPHSYNLYIEMLEAATEYIWFYTPYLMLGEQLFDVMIRTARRGIDVRIYMPGIPDKKSVYELSRSYYKPLLEAGVNIYEYTPGFLHAKACIMDDVMGTVGTVNLDYRSLFLHFECNSIFYKASLLKDLKKDMQDLQKECRQRRLEDMRSGLFKRVWDGVKRLFAPLC